ncbi:uncharacterized protein G2W53_000906 [Senna tora]|uniref:Uncharacterized protein n=1 Tax=Senna tora TaxID=362788 RepID=A0A835CI52_9FABA|nr:uncharacterized protein G2W53_000906 [Senna tora]
MTNGQLFRMEHLNGRENELRQLFNFSADLVIENVNHMNGDNANEVNDVIQVGEEECGQPMISFASLSMASSSFGESRGIPVVGIQNTYCDCGFGDREPSNQDTNNSEQSPVDNIDFTVLEARVAKIESMLGWVKICIAFVMFVVVILMLKL